MLLYDKIRFARPMPQRTRLIELWLQVVNGGSRGIRVAYSAATQTVKITGPVRWLSKARSKYQQALAVNALTWLPIKRLDLRGTPFSDVGQLKDLQIFELDIRGTKVADLTTLETVKSLRTVIVDADRFTPDQLSPEGSFIEFVPLAPDEK